MYPMMMGAFVGASLLLTFLAGWSWFMLYHEKRMKLDKTDNLHLALFYTAIALAGWAATVYFLI